MSTNFDWSKYETVKPTDSTAQPTFNWDAYESVPMPGLKVQQTFGEQALETGIESAKGLGRIGARGAGAVVTAPSKAIGGGLQLLSKIGRKGEPGEIKGMGTRMIKAAGEYFSNLGESEQAKFKKNVEDLLGQSYGTGEEALAKFTERAGTIYGSGPFKGMGVPAVVGGATGQIAEEMGASPQIQQIAELAGVMGPDLAKGIKSLVKEPRYSESGLQLPSLVEKTGEKLKGIKAKVFGGKKEKVYQEVSTQAEELIGKIKKEQLPLTKEIEEGIDVTGRTQKNLQQVDKLATKMTNKIESTQISDYLNSIESKINSVPVPTAEQEDILKLINKFRNKYGAVEGGKRLYTPFEYVKQFRNINEDLKPIYQTKFVHGERLPTMKFYEGLKDSITQTIEAGTPKAYSNLFKETNKEFSQLSRIERFNTIMEKVSPNGIIDAKKLNSYITDPGKSNILRKQIGKEGFDKLRLISNDLSKVQNKLKLVEELGVGDLVKSATTFGLLKFLHIPFAKTAQISSKAVQLGRGYLLTSPQGTRDVTNFLKAVQSGSEKSMRTYLLKMDENAKKYEESKSPK